MKELGWGIIGIGIHANRFMGPAISKAHNTKFIAACHPNMERAKSFGYKHGVKSTYDSFERMLKDPELEVVYIASPNNLHAQHAIQAAKSGKHVLCEKPMAIKESECEQMIEACQRNNVKLGVNFQNRYHPAHVKIRNLIQEGKVGEIYVARAQYCSGYVYGHWQGWRNDPDVAGAGALMGLGLHPIDLVRYVMGSDVEEVQSIFVIQTPYHKVDEMVYATLKLQNGAYCNLVSGILAPRSDNDLVLYGTQAKVTSRGTLGMQLQGELLVEGDSINIKMSFPVEDPITGNYVRVVEAFNKCIEENNEPDISGANGLQMTKITNAILQSSREGKSVKLRSNP